MIHTNILNYLNRFIFGTTIILYVTVFLGLLSQIVLGGFQVLFAIILLFFYKKIQKVRQKQLIVYWFLVAVYGVLWFSGLRNVTSDFFDFLFYVLIPLSIASYFTFIVESIKNEI